MTMQREHRNGPFIIECDECSETKECEGFEFSEALEDAKSEGWLVRKRNTTWMHFCSSQCEEADYARRRDEQGR